GAFLIPTGKGGRIANLPQVLEIGQRLLRLSNFRGFSAFVRGFRNPAQFDATAFEAEAADHVSRLPRFGDLVFSPEYLVRGHTKHPDFDTYYSSSELVTAECKLPRLHLQQVYERAGQLQAVIDAEVQHRLPSDKRLEIEILGPVSGSMQELATRLLDA